MYERWLPCDCLGDDGRPPLMSPAYMSEVRTYYLRRLIGGGRPAHAVSCPFYRDQADYLEAHNRTEPAPVCVPQGYFSVLKPQGEHLAQAPDGHDSHRAHRLSVPRLAKLLWQLIENAETNVVEAIGDRPRPSIALEFAKLKSAAEGLWIAPGIPLRDMLFTHPDDFRSNRIYARLRAAAETWPKGHEPQAFLLLYAASVDKRAIHVSSGEPMLVTSDIKHAAEKDAGGPCLVLVAIGKQSQARGYAAVEAFAQPIVNGRSFMPVETTAQRQLLEMLMQLQWDLNASGVATRFKRPLFDSDGGDQSIRPDALIEICNHNTGEQRLQALMLGPARVPDMQSLPAGPTSSYRVNELLIIDPALMADGQALRAGLTERYTVIGGDRLVAGV
ncbi:MAG: hypothetical protein H7267_02785 [Sandarakinorhabdus sp.]|nr:hypothetical protein [Sandarakinorhabdus sp.]